MAYWRKLNYLIPDPDCDTNDNAITEWRDARPQPTDAEINAVNLSDVQAKEDNDKEDRGEFPNVIIQIAKALRLIVNKQRVAEGKQPLTMKQYIKALRAL